MKTKLALIGIAGFTLLAFAAPHDWLLRTGKTFSGEYVSSGTTTVVIRHDGTNCFIRISDLATNELPYLADMQFTQRLARLDAEAKQMQQSGMIELSAKLIENFPEKVLPYRKGWMDVTFNGLSQAEVDISEIEVGLFVTDQNSDSFFGATISKQLNRPDENTRPVLNPLASWVLGLSSGDRVRLIGHCYPKFSDSLHETAGTPDKAGFLVERIEVIESAAEKKAKEDAAANQSDNSQ